MTAEARCDHDMLVIDGQTTCADCLKLPDVPLIDDLFTSSVHHNSPAFRHIDRRKWDGRTADDQTYCVRCSEPIKTEARWSVDDGGLVGECCDEAAA